MYFVVEPLSGFSWSSILSWDSKLLENGWSNDFLGNSKLVKKNIHRKFLFY